MGKDEKIEIIDELYHSMQNYYLDRHSKSNSSDYGDVKEALKRARRVGAVWADFYKLHDVKMEEGKRDYIAELRKDGIDLRLINKEDGLYLSGCDERIPESTKLEDFYDDLMEKDIANINSFKIIKKIPEDKKIGLEDIFRALNYFEGNIC